MAAAKAGLIGAMVSCSATTMSAQCPSYLAYKDRDVFPFYDRLLTEDPVHWDENMNAWLVSRFEDCSHIMRREDIFGHPYAAFKGAAEVQGGVGVGRGRRTRRDLQV